MRSRSVGLRIGQALLLFLVVISFGFPYPAIAATMLSNISQTNDKGTDIFRSNIWVAHKFTAGAAATITSVTIDLSHTASNYINFSTYTSGVVRFYHDNSGVVGSSISGTLAYTSTNTGTGVTVYSNASGTISIPSAGTYWIAFTCASCANIDYQKTSSTTYSGSSGWATIISSSSISTSNNSGSTWGTPYSSSTYGIPLMTIDGTLSNSAPSTTAPSSISQAADGTGYVTFQTALTDTNGDTSSLKVEYSDDGGTTWYDPDLVSVSGDGSPTLDDAQTYQLQSITSTSDGNTLTVVWNTMSASNGSGSLEDTNQSDIKIRVTPYDGTTEGTAQTSSAFTVDNQDPSVSTLSPADNATSVATSANLVLTFSEAVDAESGNITIYKASDDSVVEAVSVAGGQVSGSGTTSITINPTSTLSEQTSYYVLIATTAFDDANGNSYAGISSTTTWNFTTADETAPTVTGFSPSDNATDVSTLPTLTLTFSEAVDAETGNITIYRASDNTAVQTISVTASQVSGSGTSSITITPSSLSNGTSYYIQIDSTAFDDIAGNSYTGIADASAWNFSTVASGTTTSSSGGSPEPLPDPVERVGGSESVSRGNFAGKGGKAVVVIARNEPFVMRLKAPDFDQVRFATMRISGTTHILERDVSDPNNPIFVATIPLGPRSVQSYSITVDYGSTTRHRQGIVRIEDDAPSTPLPIVSTSATPRSIQRESAVQVSTQAVVEHDVSSEESLISTIQPLPVDSVQLSPILEEVPASVVRPSIVEQVIDSLSFTAVQVSMVLARGVQTVRSSFVSILSLLRI